MGLAQNHRTLLEFRLYVRTNGGGPDNDAIMSEPSPRGVAIMATHPGEDAGLMPGRRIRPLRHLVARNRPGLASGGIVIFSRQLLSQARNVSGLNSIAPHLKGLAWLLD